VNDVLRHYQSLPRPHLQRELRRITGIEALYLWEYVGLRWLYREVRADVALAPKLGVQIGDVIGYQVLAGHVFGGALTDLINTDSVNETPPYPDPFR
jgi:hypothetical protein